MWTSPSASTSHAGPAAPLPAEAGALIRAAAAPTGDRALMGPAAPPGRPAALRRGGPAPPPRWSAGRASRPLAAHVADVAGGPQAVDHGRRRTVQLQPELVRRHAR